MSNHGTACTVGQLGEIGGNVIRALPNAVKLLQEQGILFPKKVVAYSQEGERLSCALAVVFKMMYDGNADIAALLGTYYIDCDAEPFVPNGWEVEEHQKGGRLLWDALAQADCLYLSAAQKNGDSIEGNKLRKELAGKPVLSANVLDYLLANQHLIPEEWKDKAVFFWGTVYRGSGGGLYVRYLYWDGDRWDWNYHWLGLVWYVNYPAALRAS